MESLKRNIGYYIVSKIWIKIRNKTRDKAWYKVEDKIWGKVYDKAEHKVVGVLIRQLK